MQNLPARVNQLTEICDNPKPDDSSHRFFAVWGFNTEDLYKIALKFFKGLDSTHTRTSKRRIYMTLRLLCGCMVELNPMQTLSNLTKLLVIIDRSASFKFTSRSC